MQKMMKRQAICFALGSLALLLASCVKEGGEVCESYLRVVYSYNMEYKDLFDRQASFFDLFVFDAETGLFDREIRVEGPFAENYRMKIPADMQGRKYHFVLWAGLHFDSYDFPHHSDRTELDGMIPGVSTMEDLLVHVKGHSEQKVDRVDHLEPLWHGILRDVEYPAGERHTVVMPLVKNTNTFRVVLQTLDAVQSRAEAEPIDIDDFDVRIYSANGRYNHLNSVLDDHGRHIEYLPHYTGNDPEAGGIAELSTMRLMDSRANNLMLSDKASGNTILNLDLNVYLNALKFQQWLDMPLQEYMDREDKYAVLILLQKEAGEGWVAASIEINGWLLRVHNVAAIF
jgi:hypothetical protein